MGMAFIGMDGKWIRTNNSLCDMLGYSMEELAALTFRSITPPADLATDRVAAHRLFIGEIENYEGEQRFYHKNGQILGMHINGWIVRDHDGCPECFFVQFQQAAPRREAQRAEEAPAALHFVAGFDGYFKKLSPSWSEALGYSLEYLFSIPYLDLVHPEDRESTMIEAQRVTERFNTFLFENRYRHADGAYRWMVWTSLSKPEEELVYGVALSYSNRRDAERDLERTLQEVKSIFSDLGASQAEIAKLREGLVTFCAWTKQIFYDDRWMSVDEFLANHLRLNLTHGISDEALKMMVANLKQETDDP